MKMMDMGHKMDGPEAAPISEGKDKVYYPGFHLDNPPEELAAKNVGDTCRIECVVKISSKTANDNGKGMKTSMALDVMKMGYKADGEKKTKDEYLNMKDDERDAYDKEQIEDEDA